jgi:hypothetical protein
MRLFACAAVALVFASSVAMAGDDPVAAVGSGSLSLAGLLKLLFLGAGSGGIAGFLAQWLGKKNLDPALIQKIIDDLRRVVPDKLPIPVPDGETVDIRRIIEEIVQTEALVQDIKAKGTPTAVTIAVTFRDGTGRTVDYGTKAIPAPAPAA